MKIDYKQKLQSRPVKRPSFFARTFFRVWTTIKCRHDRVQFTYEFDKNILKKQQILFLSTHASRNDFFYTMRGLGRCDLNIVAGFQNFFASKTNYFGMTQMNAIPKLLYQPDTSCTRKMLKVIKSGGSLALFPEGIQSLSGSTHPINPATCKFIKKAGVLVILANTQGSYLTCPRYIREEKRGKVFVNYKILFTPDELKQLTEEQIYQKLIQNFRYDDFAFNKTARIKYVGKSHNVKGIDNILYICPKCKQAHTMKVHLDKGNERFECEKCGYTVTINEYYDLVVKQGESYFDDVDKWCKWQRRVVRNQVQQDGYQLTGHGKITKLRTDSWKKYPQNRITVIEGEVTLDKTGLTVTNHQDTVFFDISGLYSLTMATGRFLEFYHNDDYYNLVLDCPPNQLIEWMLVSEELHNLMDDKWNSASNDVFDYNAKGENL